MQSESYYDALEMADARRHFDLDSDHETQPSGRVSSSSMVGGTVAGRFRVTREIGRGSIGVVYAGTVEAGPHRGSACAIKLIRCDGPGAHERAAREGQLLEALRGPQLVEVLASGVTPPFAFVVMELLFGEDLDARLLRVGRLSRTELLPLSLGIAMALDHAHGRGVVHRDLKPSNVYLAQTPSGEAVKLLDLGLAKRLEDVRLTASGILLGSPMFMAPEQIERPSEVDARADLWSFAVILYVALVGATPFSGSGGRLLAAIRAAAHVPVKEVDPSLSEEVEDFFAIALAKEPERRFQSAGELQRAITIALGA